MIADKELDKGLLNLKIIWFTMLVSLVIYLVLGLYAGAILGATMKEDVFWKVRASLYIVAFVTLVAAIYVRKFLLSRMNQHHPSSQMIQNSEIQKYSAMTIVTLAMSESIGIYGLILFLLGGNSLDLYLLIIISGGAILMWRPRRNEVVGPAGGAMPAKEET